jgi:transmembrane sensor
MSQGDDAERSGPKRNETPPLDPVQDEALRWFIELQAAEGDPAARRAFDAWLAQDRRHAAAFAKVAELWNSSEFGKALTSHGRVPERNNGRGQLATMTAERPRAPASRSWGRPIAAIAAVLIFAGAAAHYSGLLLYLRADYVTATGQQQRISLPDGSTVLLNSGSAITLDFGDARRVVRLIEGEAFFDVAPNPDRPFHVAGRFADVEVTGTAFSVRATGETDNVTLQRGSVSVRPRSAHARAVKLLPRYAVAVGASETGAVNVVDPNDAFAWLEGRIRFRDRRLGDVLDELRRYHRGVIIVANARITDIRVSGNYRVDDPALVVASLADAVGATLTRLSDRVLILR